MMFPRLEKVYLFEPLATCYEYLTDTFGNDPRIEIFPYAIADDDISTQLHVTNNGAASSSILPLGKYLELFPEVHSVATIPVTCRALNSVIAEHHLMVPDMLFIDVQGTEYTILSSLSYELLSNVKLIYSEASKKELFVGSRILDEIKELLVASHHFAGFCPLKFRYFSTW